MNLVRIANSAQNAQEHRPQARSLFNLSRVRGQRRAEDATKGEDEHFHDFLLTEQGKRWLASVIQREHELRGSLRRKLQGTKDIALEKIVAALRDPLTLDSARAEWVAHQLLESGEKGILLPVNVVLDAYIRGKSRARMKNLTAAVMELMPSYPSMWERYYLRKHALRTTAYVAASCALVHLAKRGLKKATKHVKYLGPAVAFLADVALPTPVVGPLLMARCML